MSWQPPKSLATVVMAMALLGAAAVLGATRIAKADTEEVYYDFVNEAGQLGGGRVTMPSAIKPRRLTAAVSDNRIHIVLVGDGYTSAQMATYAIHANSVTSTFFASEPFKTYMPLFVTHRIDVVSSQSGVDNDPTLGTLRNTALDMGFFCNDIERLLCVNVTKAFQYANTAPAVNYVLAIANSTKYGGAGYPSSALATVSGGNDSAVEIALHELGHAIGNLADEYDYYDGRTYTSFEPSEPNVSILSSSQMLATNSKWASWIGVDDSLYNGLVSTYEGAYYCQYGIYRPTAASKMRYLNYPFNLPCIEALIINFYKTVRPIDSATPNTTPLGPSATVVVDPVDPIGKPLSIRWIIDGQGIPGATGTSINLKNLPLGGGSHLLSVEVTDNTTWVRNESARNQYLRQTRNWTVVVVPGDFDGDTDVDSVDLDQVIACATGPSVPYNTYDLPAGCTLGPDYGDRIAADLDRDGDIDQTDFAVFQRCWSGQGIPGNANCVN